LTGRRWKSASISEYPSGEVVEPNSQTRLLNIGLAVALVGFCGFVFTYSMNAVGRVDTNKETSGEDPLARLKAEAQEAKDHRVIQKAQRMTPEEVAALESGTSNRKGDADIAQLEDEANRKLFQNGEEAPKKKKPWWRFGF
jgi:hypothetical protein